MEKTSFQPPSKKPENSTPAPHPEAHLSTKRSQEGIMKAFVATGGPF